MRATLALLFVLIPCALSQSDAIVGGSNYFFIQNEMTQWESGSGGSCTLDDFHLTINHTVINRCPNQHFQLYDLARGQLTFYPAQKPPKEVVRKKQTFLVILLVIDDCLFCDVLSRLLTAAAPGYPEVSFARGLIDDFDEFVSYYNIVSAPALLLFREGILVDRFRGPKTLHRLAFSLSKLTGHSPVSALVGGDVMVSRLVQRSTFFERHIDYPAFREEMSVLGFGDDSASFLTFFARFIIPIRQNMRDFHVSPWLMIFAVIFFAAVGAWDMWSLIKSQSAGFDGEARASGGCSRIMTITRGVLFSVMKYFVIRLLQLAPLLLCAGFFYLGRDLGFWDGGSVLDFSLENGVTVTL